MASSGIGARSISPVRCRQAHDTQLNHIPYKGSGQAVVDLISGQVNMNFDTMRRCCRTSRKAGCARWRSHPAAAAATAGRADLQAKSVSAVSTSPTGIR